MVFPSGGCVGANTAAAKMEDRKAKDAEFRIPTLRLGANSTVQTVLTYPVHRKAEGPFDWIAAPKSGIDAVRFQTQDHRLR